MIKPALLRVATFASLSILTLAAAAGASSSPVTLPFDATAVDRFVVAQMARHRIPGLAVAITQGDQVVFVRRYGEARTTPRRLRKQWARSLIYKAGWSPS